MKMTTCKVTDERFRNAAKILDDWRFIYEITPRGKLRAEPMDLSISDRLIQKLGSAGYFSLPCRGGLIISQVNQDELIISVN